MTFRVVFADGLLALSFWLGHSFCRCWLYHQTACSSLGTKRWGYHCWICCHSYGCLRWCNLMLHILAGSRCY
uniref:U18-Liphistoxin-Lth1a_1 n=1 Tax=Liphistius thaleban TaxID=1905330 RepID=A0A4Q8K2J5_9ARAC